MAQFRPFEMEGRPIRDQFAEWPEGMRIPYDKRSVDAYTRCRVLLMGGIENNSMLTSHAIALTVADADVNEQLLLIRRLDARQQQIVNWLNPANQSVIETTIAYEQMAAGLTANLAKNEPDRDFRKLLSSLLLEDFDHLFRFAYLMDSVEHKDPKSITQGKTEIKPGRPTVIRHLAPLEAGKIRFHKHSASAKTWMNYRTIVAAEQQTALFYKFHGFMYPHEAVRDLYADIAEIEEQHVSQYELAGCPGVSGLEMITITQLCEAYNYYSCAETEPDERIRGIWEHFCADEVTHFLMCNELLRKVENKDIRDLLKTDAIEPLVVFEPGMF